MVKIFSLILSFFLIFTIAQAQQKYSPKQLRQDVDVLVKSLQDTHPNPFYRYPKSSFFRDVNLIKNNLTDSLTKIDFYLRVEPLLGHLEDGHTDMAFPNDYYDYNPFVFPYYVKVSTQKPYIVLDKASSVIKSQLPVGAQIISVNNIPALQMVNDIVRLNTGENRPFRAEYGAENFDFYLEALYKANGIYRVKYKSHGVLKSITIKGIRKNELNELHKKEKATAAVNTDPVYAIKFWTQDKTALIDFKAFDWDGFSKFLDSTFKELKQKNTQNLIINLMGNGGGDSDVGDEFFQYLLDTPFTQYSKILEKNSELLKFRLREHRQNKPFSDADKKLLAKLNGSVDTVYKDKIAIRKNPLRFNGRVILLTDTKTYSSAADFAQCFKYYKRGVIIGQETGGLIKSYGDIVSTYLPNTQLQLIISSKLYYNVGAGENDWHGVIPDIKTLPDKALQRAFDYILEQK
jgi:C-terminal processing protease CtpA/Prc